MPKFVEQGNEIRRICREAGLTEEQMAERVALKPDSMRKIANGYQPCSEQLMQSFRNVAQFERLRQQVPDLVITHEPRKKDAISQAIGDLEQIAAADPKKAKELAGIISSVKQSINLSPDDVAKDALKRGVESVKRPGVVFGKKRKAG